LKRSRKRKSVRKLRKIRPNPPSTRNHSKSLKKQAMSQSTFALRN